MKFRAYAWLPLAAALLPQFAAAAAFTPGNLVVYRVGDGSAALSSAGTALFIDEYSPTGSLAQTIALPIAASGSNKACVGSGTATSEGLVSRSADGKYLVGACYATVPGTASITGSAATTINRVAFRLDAAGNTDTSTALTDSASAGNPRGVASLDGTTFWMTGSTGGLHYATLGATTSTQVLASPANVRTVADFGSQMYITSSSGSTRVATVGSGMPTTAGQTATNLTGTRVTGSPYGVVLLNLTGGAGPDTMYVADDGAGIIKYSLVAGSWTANGTIGTASDAFRGLSGTVNAGTVILYATSATKLATATDTAGYNATVSSTATTTLVSAPGNTAFRGLAFAPASATLSLAAPAAIGEGDSGSTAANFSATLDAPAPVGGVTFTIDTADGTATAGSDYTAIVGTSGKIAEGSRSATLPVSVLGDTAHEGDETFALNLSSIAGTTNATASATATITDDDPLIALSIGDVQQNEGTGGTTNFTFTVSLSSPAKSDVTFDIATADGTATTADNDYVAQALVGQTIPAGSSSYQFTVVVNGDSATESDETFLVNVSNISGLNVSTTSAQGTGTIQNDDNVPITVSINDVTQAEGDSGTTNFVFTVSLSAPAAAGGVTFDIATRDGGAFQGSDYVAQSLAAQTIPAGQSSYQFTVAVKGDTTIESDETFFVDVSNIAGTSVTNTDTLIGTGKILNDDVAVTASMANLSQNEGNAGTSTFAFTLSLSAPAPLGGVTFDIATQDGTATAASGDYVAQSLTAQTIPAGSTSYTFNVTVNGDTTYEPDETFSVKVSNVVGANVSPSSLSATGTIVNDDPQPYTIMQIQGHGTASPLVGLTVTTPGNIVTALKSNGFFMQDPAGDGDLTTSDAVFVFTGGAPTVHLGDQVTVTAKVQEFSGSTEMTAPVIQVTATNQPLPAAYALDSHPPTNDPTTGICMGGNSTIPNPPLASDGYQASNFACLDGMLVTMQNAISTGSAFGTGQDGVTVPAKPTETWAKINDGSPHPMRAAGALWPGIGPGIPVWNGEPEVITVYYKGLPAFDATGYAYNDGTTFSVTGVMQGFTATGTTSPIYELYPVQMTTINAVSAPQEVKPVPQSAAGTLTIGSQNLLHFFNDTSDGADTSGYSDHCTGTGVNDTCPTAAEYAIRLSKWTQQICDVLHAPVVVDLEEIENLSVARDLASHVGAYCGTTYIPYVIPGNDVSGINIGILARSDVLVSSVTQMYAASATSNCGGTPPPTQCPLNDRPPVLMRASWNGYPFALLAIYDRSLSGLGDPAKPYIGPKRAEQAAQIAQIAQAFQSGATLTGAGDAQQDATGLVTNGSFDIVGDASVPLIVAGDFNAYEFSDGYADVTGMIKGTAVQSQNLYWYSGSAVDTDTPAYVAPNPPLTDSGDRAAPSNRYSYNFSGLRQEIDHILLSQRAMRDFVSIGNAHGDADTSGSDAAVLDGSTPARSGDHDGQVVTLAIDRIFANGLESTP